MPARDFLLPDLGEGLEEAEIVAWNVSVGDSVELNQDICEVETAKAVVSVPCPFSGTVLERFGEVGDTLEVGAPLIRIETAAPSDAGPTTARKPAIVEGPERPDVLVGYGESRRTHRRRGEVVKPLVKPPVRKLAKDLGVDPVAIAPGSGPAGTVTSDDVRAAAASAAAGTSSFDEGGGQLRTPGEGGGQLRTPGEGGGQLRTPGEGGGHPRTPGEGGGHPRTPGEPGSSVSLSGVRKRVAEKMVRSRSEIPEATCGLWIDCTALWEVRGRLSSAATAEGEQVALTPFALLLRATVLALRRFPVLNARIDPDAGEIRLLEEVHLGVATDAPQGLIVPVIRNAERLSTLDLVRDLQRLSDAARQGSIGGEELVGSTFTVTNYGAFGIDDGNPVINYPESAILGVGAMKERPWIADGEVAVRRVAKLVCVFDHRVMDGAEAGRFLAYLGALVEDPARMLLRA